MKPARQGAFDALCGLYSIVNAVELVGIRGRRSAFHRVLFWRLVRGVGTERLTRAVVSGIDTDDLVDAARKAFRSLRRSYGIRLSMTRAVVPDLVTDLHGFGQWARMRTADGRTAVIINVVTPWVDHWTVVGRVELGCIRLRDSGVLERLDFKRFGVKGSYRVNLEDVLVINRSDDLGEIRAQNLVRSRRASS